MSWIQELWRDPVWSKVIAGLIAAPFSLLFPPIRHLVTRALDGVVKYWRRRVNGFLHFLPILGIIVGGLIFVCSIVWVLADGRRVNQEIAETLTRYVLPRHLTDQQIAAISKYLQQFPPREAKFLLIRNSEEASAYRADFQRALTDGGWNIVGINYSDDVQEGLTTNFMQTPASSQSRPDPRNPKTDELFAQALRQARLRLGGSSSGSGINVMADSFEIRIGRRRMDDGDLKGRQQMKERARKVLEDSDDSGPLL